MLMNTNKIVSCYLGPEISPEQFIAEHFFLYLAQGKIEGYDGYKKYTMKAGECCIVRKNHLARYSKQKDNGHFEKVVIVFDEAFLKDYQQTHNVVSVEQQQIGAFLLLKSNPLIPAFLQSLMPYYQEGGKVNDIFSKVKREELLLILLQSNPELSGILFNFGAPQKLNLEAFMNRNYKFNISIGRFAYLTGRSLSAFKRDFTAIFSDTPSRWLVQKRLQEAHFLISKKGKKPSDVYLELGFEDLSHFSFSFKKKFGFNPSNLT